MNCEFEEQAALYALAALSETESVAFAEHRAHCFACGRTVLEFEEVAAELVDSTAAEPPSRLRARVLRALTIEAQSGADSASIPTISDGGGPSTNHPASSVAETESLSVSGSANRIAPQRSTALSPGPLVRYAGFAAAGFLPVLGLFVLFQRGVTDSKFDEMAAMPDVVITELDGFSGKLTVAWSDELDKVAVDGEGLDDLDERSAYALWFVVGDEVAPAGLFRAAKGQVDHAFEVDDIDPDGWGVTIEPREGSRQPTSKLLYSEEI